jgi:spore coat protein U-like protein
MKTTLNTVSKVLAATALVAIAGLAQAEATITHAASANISITTTIIPKCTISTTPVAFGNFDPFTGNDLTTAGTVVVGCTKASPGLWVGLGDGAHAASGQRKMKHDTLADTLDYALVIPAAGEGGACPAFGSGSAWTNTSATALNLTPPSSYATRTYNVCGQLAKGQDSSVGAYTDTVVATVNF